MTARQLAALRELAALAEVGVAPSPPPPTSIRVIPNPRLTRRRFSLALSFPPELVELIGHALIGKDPKMIQSTHYGDLCRSSLVCRAWSGQMQMLLCQIVVLRDHHQLKAFVRSGLTHRYRTPQLSLELELELEKENTTAKERRRMRRHPDESDETTGSLCKTLMRTAQGVVSLSIGACDFELDQESIDNLKDRDRQILFGFFNTYGGILAHMVLSCLDFEDEEYYRLGELLKLSLRPCHALKVLKLTATQFAKLIDYIPATVQIQQLTLQYSVTTRTAAIEAADQAMKMIRAPCLDDLWYLGVQQEKQNLFGQQVEGGGVMFFASFGQREEVPPFDIEVYWEPLKQFCRDNKILFRFNLDSW
ncbi:BZ3500_MvSof-1268-A1-R1_Chr6-1g08368 [Microbotryum saponariae]|uniref:BZ3500_MvSof-1268-A1-R1_Chr6-1g08368 protein n=1 Tax=Microbotryum saponariae TaxID=289078 RepID=A0A2X0KPP1_9BASI|nr:BZ3500_MvSof-1268-A1-R1_Chr6-1g08368 [Microbotryum saponariae]SDA07652.1 BZ3501_MvSof-1269-A2-R1_Chr6-1g08089 [Microbotryum saponariae]